MRHARCATHRSRAIQLLWAAFLKAHLLVITKLSTFIAVLSVRNFVFLQILNANINSRLAVDWEPIMVLGMRVLRNYSAELFA